MQGGSSAKANGRAGRFDGIGGRGSSGALSFSQIDGGVLRDFLATVVGAGDAVLFGRTSDGGALRVQIVADDKPKPWYVTDAAELLDTLQMAINVYKAG